MTKAHSYICLEFAQISSAEISILRIQFMGMLKSLVFVVNVLRQLIQEHTPDYLDSCLNSLILISSGYMTESC